MSWFSKAVKSMTWQLFNYTDRSENGSCLGNGYVNKCSIDVNKDGNVDAIIERKYGTETSPYSETIIVTDDKFRRLAKKRGELREEIASSEEATEAQQRYNEGFSRLQNRYKALKKAINSGEIFTEWKGKQYYFYLSNQQGVENRFYLFWEDKKDGFRITFNNCSEGNKRFGGEDWILDPSLSKPIEEDLMELYQEAKQEADSFKGQEAQAKYEQDHYDDFKRALEKGAVFPKTCAQKNEQGNTSYLTQCFSYQDKNSEEQRVEITVSRFYRDQTHLAFTYYFNCSRNEFTVSDSEHPQALWNVQDQVNKLFWGPFWNIPFVSEAVEAWQFKW